MVDNAITSGDALAKAKEWFAAQNADLTIFDSEDWQTAPVVLNVEWHGDPSYVQQLDNQIIGQAVVDLGGGRKSKSDKINPTVGIETLVEVGSQLQTGQVVARIHAADDASAHNAAEQFLFAIRSSANPVPSIPIMLI